MEQQREHIYSYPDGTVYMGHMLNEKRHGRGTLRTPAFVYGMSLNNYTSDEAAENAHLAKWHEYKNRATARKSLYSKGYGKTGNQ
jgi:hypothetical protein